MSSEIGTSRPMVQEPMAVRLEAAKESIRQRNLPAFDRLRRTTGSAESGEAEFSYLLMLVADAWRHPGRLPSLKALAESEQVLAPQAREIIVLLQQHVFAGWDTGYVGGSCHQSHSAPD